MSRTLLRSLLSATGACLLSTPVPSQAGGFCRFHSYTSTSTIVPGATPIMVAPASAYRRGAGLHVRRSGAGVYLRQCGPRLHVRRCRAGFHIRRCDPGFDLRQRGPRSRADVVVLPVECGPFGSSVHPDSRHDGDERGRRRPCRRRPHRPPRSVSRRLRRPRPGIRRSPSGATRGLDGGRFVVFLRNLVRGSIPELGGQGTAVTRSILRQFLAGLIRSQLGLTGYWGTRDRDREPDRRIPRRRDHRRRRRRDLRRCRRRDLRRRRQRPVRHDPRLRQQRQGDRHPRRIGRRIGRRRPGRQWRRQGAAPRPTSCRGIGTGPGHPQARASNGNAEVPPPTVQPVAAPVLPPPPAPAPGVPAAAQDDTADPRAAPQGDHDHPQRHQRVPQKDRREDQIVSHLPPIDRRTAAD